MCSAACSVPRSVGICSRPARCSASGQNQIASVSNDVSGMSIGTTSIVELSRVALRAYAIDLLGHGDSAEDELDAEALLDVEQAPR